MKILAIAAAEGQRIYTINASNVEQVLGSVSLGTETEQEIRNAAYAGKEIATHQNQIDFNGWIGEGYIILDPETGAGAYKIAGGENGGLLKKIDNFVAKGYFYIGIFESGAGNIGFYKAIGGALLDIFGVGEAVVSALIACWNSAGAFIAGVLAGVIAAGFIALQSFLTVTTAGLGKFLFNYIVIIGHIQDLVIGYVTSETCS